MTVFDDAIKPTDQATIRSRIILFAKAAELDITNWPIIDTAVQILETVVAMATSVTQVIPTYIRGFTSLDLSTDPGDADAFDPNNINQAPAPGFLSEFGKNIFDTERQEAAFATGFVTFTNGGLGSRTLVPGGLICTWTANSPPNPAPTYVSTDDAVVYPGGSVVVPAGTSIALPIVCQIAGTAGSCPAGSLSLTTSLAGCSATNAAAVIGSDRESADNYRGACRQAVSRLSLAGPEPIYLYLARKNLGGTPLLNAAVPPAPTSIARVYVSQSSSTGIVNVYYASDSGPAIAEDVTAANANIEVQSTAVPGTRTFTGLAAIALVVHVQGTAKIRGAIGVTALGTAQKIVAALVEKFRTFPIGGVDQDNSGNGVLYPGDIQDWAAEGVPGLYHIVISLPAGTQALTVGHVAVLQSDPVTDWVVTVVP